MAELTITHTHADGTMLDGSCKGDGVYEIVKRHGFAYFPSIKAIGIRQSRDQIAKRYQIDRAAAALREAGHEVDVQIDDEPRARGTVLEDQAERLDQRADRLAAKATRHASAADAAYNRASQIAERFAGGQPIILGHHSTRRALRDREKMQQADARSVAEQKVADDVAYRAGRVGKQAQRSQRPDVIRRRIDTTESELRIIARNLAGYTNRHLDSNGNPFMVDPHKPAAGTYREQLLARQALLTERISYDRQALADAEAAGFVVWDKDNVHVGDLVKYWGGWKTVEKVNKVTVGCPSGYTWQDKVKFTDVLDVQCPHREGAEPVELTSVVVADKLAEATERHAPVDARPVRIPERDTALAAALAAPTVYAPGYFPTPPALAARVAGMLPDGPLTVLEPSAGDGALVRAVLDARPEATVTAVEPNLQLVQLLGRVVTAGGPAYPSEEPPRARVYCCNFEDFGSTRDADSAYPEQFGAVVMNPPFSAPGHPVLWAEHVLRAYDLLEPGGRLVAIVPAGFAYRQDRVSTRVRELVTELGGGWEDLPAGTFKTAGTQVRTVLVWLTRPRPIKASEAVTSWYQPATLFDLATAGGA